MGNAGSISSVKELMLKTAGEWWCAISGKHANWLETWVVVNFQGHTEKGFWYDRDICDVMCFFDQLKTSHYVDFLS
jgi:hypothetical protein